MDDVDRASARELQDTASALAAHLRRVRAESAPPRPDCVECGEVLVPARIAIAACRCVQCLQDHEQRERFAAMRRL